MTGDTPFTHTLGRFAEECKPWLYRWFPELERANDPKWLGQLDSLLSDAKTSQKEPDEAVNVWLKWIQEPGILGLRANYEIGQIPRDDHEVKDPVEELVVMRGTDEGIIMIETPED